MFRLAGISMMSLLLTAPIFASDSLTSQDGQDKEKKPKKERWWAIDLGIFRPVDSDIRDRFGDVLFRAGVRPYQVHTEGNMMLAFDLTFITAANRGNHLLAIPATIGFLSSYGNPEDARTFFWDIGGGPAYFDYDIDRVRGNTTTNFSGRGWGIGAHVEAGMTIEKRTTITARYDWLSKREGFDFGGFSINLTYAAVKW